MIRHNNYISQCKHTENTQQITKEVFTYFIAMLRYILNICICHWPKHQSQTA